MAAGTRLGAGVAELDRRGRLEHRVVVVELRQDERPRTDRRPAERIVGEFADRDRLEEVRRRDRLGGQLEEPAERRGQVDPDRPLVDRRRRDLAPRPGARARVLGIAEDVDRVDDVARGDRRAVVPAGVGAERERPAAARRVSRPAGGEARDQRPVRAARDEAREDERDEVPVGLAAGRERVHGDRPAEHALAVRDDVGRARLRRRLGGRGRERRRSDQDRDDAEKQEEAANDGMVDSIHPGVGIRPGWAAGELGLRTSGRRGTTRARRRRRGPAG